MVRQPVILYLALILSVLISCVGAWIVASRYRRRMRQLMSAPPSGRHSPPSLSEPLDLSAPRAVSLADNRAAGLRLSLLLIGSSCLVATTSAILWWRLSFPGEPLLPKRIAVIALLHLWPVVPALALVWRWSRTRLFGTLLIWCAASFAIMLWRQIEFRPLQALAAMISEVGLSLALLSLMFLGNATRAVAPWLILPVALLMWMSLTSLDVTMLMMERRSPLLMWLLVRLGEDAVFAVPLLAALMPWVLAWWVARMLGRLLGAAYSRKWLSDLMVVFPAVWAFALTDRALTVANQAGARAVLMYLPLLWIPPAIWLAGRLRRHTGRPPTLLILRVFQQVAGARGLFDHVVERWRLSGNTVLIAGTDLADRTLGADDIFQFLDGRLEQRFITSPSDVPRRLAAFDLAADIDGRYRVNECYCHDTAWQDALQSLVSRTDVVLMDLRGFQAPNTGCRYELTTLARASRELRVVVLTDARTDRTAAREAIASNREERFAWIDASRFGPGKHREILARLLAAE